MNKTNKVNRSNEHLVVKGLTVLKEIESPQINSITEDVKTLRANQSTMAEQTKDYWSRVADDGFVNPEEKKILYKEWCIIKSEYIALLEEATASGLADTAPELDAYKKNYDALYNYIEKHLNLFDDMTASTELINREKFIENYNVYYSSRDKLRIAIKDGEMSDMQTDFNQDIQHIQDQIKDISQGSVADGSITADKLGADIKDDILKFEAAAVTGFLTDEILQAIDTTTAQAVDDLTLIIGSKDKEIRSYVKMSFDSINAIIDDAERKTRSMLRQTSDGISIIVEDQAEKVATQFKQTAESIQAIATDFDKEIAAGVKITADRISEMVTAGSTDAYLSLSVGVPYFITVSKFEEWRKILEDTKNGVDYLEAIYQKVNVGTEKDPVYYYVMGKDTTKTQINSLNNYLRKKDALASQVVIDADMIQVDGDTFFSSDKKIKDAYYDFSSVTSRGYADKFISELMAEGAWDPTNQTIISGGFIKTDLIDAAAIITDALSADFVAAGVITVGNQIVSENYKTSGGKEGFAFLKNGKAIIQDGEIRGTAYLSDGEFTGIIKARNVVRWYEDGEKILFQNVPFDNIFNSHGEGTIGINVAGNVSAMFFSSGYGHEEFYLSFNMTIYKEDSKTGKTVLYTDSNSGSITVNRDGARLYVDIHAKRLQNIIVYQDTRIYAEFNINAPGAYNEPKVKSETWIYQKYVNDYLRG